MAAMRDHTIITIPAIRNTIPLTGTRTGKTGAEPVAMEEAGRNMLPKNLKTRAQELWRGDMPRVSERAIL